ncbi:RDD family protein [Streptomyces sp. NPDC050400]|uniref:RDD family protein n=1 Tax=Streptomyces sp. NPDC050400 TaxID=3365610 RepID=UPI00379AD8C5
MSESAGIVSRGVAAVVDVGVLAVVGVVLHLGVGCAVFVVSGPPFRVPQLPGSVAGVAAWVLAVGYFGGSWAGVGRSPGGQLMGLRVGDRAGRALGLPRALVRAALCVTFPIGLCWIPFSRRRASLQDLLVASAVRYDRPAGD